MRRLWMRISKRSQVLVPSPQGDLRVVMRSTLVGMRTGPLTLSCLSLAPRMRSAHTAPGGGWVGGWADGRVRRARRSVAAGPRRGRARQAPRPRGRSGGGGGCPAAPGALQRATERLLHLLRWDASVRPPPPPLLYPTASPPAPPRTLLQVLHVPGGQGDADAVHLLHLGLHAGLLHAGLRDGGHLRAACAQGRDGGVGPRPARARVGSAALLAWPGAAAAAAACGGADGGCAGVRRLRAAPRRAQARRAAAGRCRRPRGPRATPGRQGGRPRPSTRPGRARRAPRGAPAPRRPAAP
jgi:hypothetical protein